MLEKLRRKSRELSAAFATTTRRAEKKDSPPSSLKQTSFLDLPPELRNQIYELVANDAKSVTLVSSSPKPIPPALFLVNHQIRSEYRPILLSHVPVRTYVHNFDFKPLMRSIGSFYSSELKALRANRDLVVCVQFAYCDPLRGQRHDSLRQWVVKRSNSLDRLPWSYHCSSVWSLSVEWGLARVQQLSDIVDENLEHELKPIEQAISDRLFSKDGIQAAWQMRSRDRSA
ncbi:hypothetical protein Q7P37_007753 [Cladosporium fusiforme]